MTEEHTHSCICNICIRRTAIEVIRACIALKPHPEHSDVSQLFQIIEQLENRLEWAETHIEYLNYERQLNGI